MKNKIIDNFCIQLPCQFDQILKKINLNLNGIIFVVNKNNKLIGSISDGDIRRKILQRNKNVDLITSSFDLINKKTIFGKISDSKEKLLELFSIQKPKIKCLPLLNKKKQIVDICFFDKLNSIPLLEPFIDQNEINNVLNCLQTGWLSSKGIFVKKFENAFSKFLGGGYAASVTNGTAAIELALATLGIKRGDEVILPNFTFGATINAVINVGAKPVVVDIDKNTWTISLKEIKKKITKKTKALVIVHIYGLVCNLREISKFVKKKKLFLIEDCAEALGSKYGNKYIGTHGDCSTFSFYPNKTITTGEGGMAVFKSKKAFNRSLILRNQGREISDIFFIHQERGFNYRMSNIQAAIGYAQMFKIKKFLSLRKNVFKFYDKVFKKHNEIELMPNLKNTENSGWLYTIKLNSFNLIKRNKLINQLKNNGIEARPVFFPLHKMKPYKEFCIGDYPSSEEVSYKSISLPSSPFLSKKELKYVSDIVIKEVEKII